MFVDKHLQIARALDGDSHDMEQFGFDMDNHEIHILNFVPWIAKDSTT